MKHADWHQFAAQIASDTDLLIDGKWCKSSDGDSFLSINPSSGETIASIASASQSDIERATSIAKTRFEQGAWSRMPNRKRIEVMYRFADLVEENAKTFAVLDTMEMGKPISDMLSIDIPGSVLTLRFMAECIDKIGGACPNTDSNALHYILRQPLGVVGCITPWNYP